MYWKFASLSLSLSQINYFVHMYPPKILNWITSIILMCTFNTTISEQDEVILDISGVLGNCHLQIQLTCSFI